MTSTPSLGRRVVGGGVAVVATALLVVNVLVFVVLQQRLDAGVDELLTERAGVVRAEAASVEEAGGGLGELARRLQARGLRVVVTTPGGDTIAADPTSPAVGTGLPAAGQRGPGRTLLVDLDGGAAAEVFASTSGVSDALRELVILQAVTSLAGLGLAALLLRRVTRQALRPVADIAAAALRTAGGHVGERLRPDRPDTQLGRMATAYDEMLDALEATLAEARDLQRARALLAAVAEGSTDAIAVQDLDGTILTWNSAAERMLGWPGEHAVGRDVSLVVPQEELPQLSGLVRQVVADGGVRGYEGERLTRGGPRTPVSVRLSPVRDDEGRIVAVAAGARDVTEQRWMATTLDSTLAALQTAAEDAQASEEATRRFLADAAHQLRTPMAGIRACAETLLRGASSEDADRLLATMVRETSRAARLIAALLRMARLDQGLPLAKEPVDVVALCAEEVERLALLAPDLDVRLDVRVDDPVHVVADAAGCREVLSNLGDNARRHARSSVRLVVEAAGGNSVVHVQDDGPGVPAEARERVFERFVSLDGAGGSGLGLPIARALARAMGGDLTCDGGFALRLPAQDGTTSYEPAADRGAGTAR